MTQGELFRQVEEIFSKTPREALSKCRELENSLPEEMKDLLWAFVDTVNSEIKDNDNEVSIILVHGIRTDALWFDIFSHAFDNEPGIRIVNASYGFFTSLGLWGPFRGSAIAKVNKEIREEIFLHPTTRKVIVAHSFGTYIVSQILAEYIDIRLEKIILCGSIIKKDFHWSKHINGANTVIVNDVGTKDLYPILAACSTFGYGGSGLMGFQTASIHDRYFNCGHSDFFTPEHISTYWKPFILKNQIQGSDWGYKRSKTAYLYMILEKGPIATLLLLLILIGAGYSLLHIMHSLYST